MHWCIVEDASLLYKLSACGGPFSGRWHPPQGFMMRVCALKCAVAKSLQWAKHVPASKVRCVNRRMRRWESKARPFPTIVSPSPSVGWFPPLSASRCSGSFPEVRALAGWLAQKCKIDQSREAPRCSISVVKLAESLAKVLSLWHDPTQPPAPVHAPTRSQSPAVGGRTWMQTALASSSTNNSSHNGDGGSPARGATGARACRASGVVHQPPHGMQARDVVCPGSPLEASDESHPHPQSQSLLHRWLASSDPSTRRHAAGILAAANLACSIATWLQLPAPRPGFPTALAADASVLPTPALPARDSAVLHGSRSADVAQAVPAKQSPAGHASAASMQAAGALSQRQQPQQPQQVPGCERAGPPSVGAAR